MPDVSKKPAGSQGPVAIVAALIGLTVGGVAMFFIAPPLKIESDQTAQEEPGGGPPGMVKLAKAKMELSQQRVQIIGQLQEVRRAMVASEVEGRVLDVPVIEGQSVVGGETVLARIDGVWSQLDLQRAEAQVQAAQANLEQSQSDLEQLERLARANSAKAKEVSDKRTEVKARQAQLNAAVSDRDIIKQQVARTDVLAPFDGQVVAKNTEIGQWLAEGDLVAEVISKGEIDAVVDVPEDFVGKLQEGQDVEIYVEPLNLRVTGQIKSVIAAGSERARTYPLQVRLDDQDGLLKPGMTITAAIALTEEANVLMVPRDAVQFEDTGSVVWTSIPMGGPMPQGLPLPVRVLYGSGDWFVVEARPVSVGMPLSPGMDVVVEGAERLYPTQPLIDLGAPQGGPPPTGEASTEPSSSSETVEAPVTDEAPDAQAG